MRRGEALARQHRCNVCHQQNFAGQRNVPRIAAQRDDYLVKALREYRGNARVGYDASMQEAMQPVDDAQIPDLAYFLARVR
jgi:cytochrome c553